MDEKSVLSFNALNPKNFQKINSDTSIKPILYYDKTSKKLVEIQQEGIRIFNRSVTNLKKDIGLKLPKDTILLTAVDKAVEYLLILTDDKKSKRLLILDLKKLKVLFIFVDDIFDYLLSFFFISKNKDLLMHSEHNDHIYFSLIFVDQIIFFDINKNTEQVALKESVNPSNKCFIKDFSYNQNFKILLCVLSNNTFDLYNLSKKKFFSRVFNISLPFIKPAIRSSGLFRNLFNKEKKINEKKRIRDIYFSRDKYTQTQFYLESIYDSLYFVVLCYEDNKIHILNVKNLINLEESISLDYPKHHFCSSLQFIDNLIIIHNFIKNSFSIVDIKSKELRISYCLKVNFPYQNNMFINGAVFTERNAQMMITSIYNVVFDSKTYEENIWKKYEKVKNEKMFYDALQNLLRRKEAKEISLQMLHRLIIEHPKIKAISKVYEEIIEQIFQSSPVALKDIKKRIEKGEKKEKNQPLEIIKTSNIFFLNKKLTIRQLDIYHTLFKKYEVENLTQLQYLRVIWNLILFAYYLNNRNIEVHKSFNLVLVCLFKKIKKMYLLYDLFNYNIMWLNNELTNYYISMANDKEHGKSFEQKALDTYKRLEQYSLIIKHLFNNGKIYEGLLYFKEIKNKCNQETISEITEIIKENKQRKEMKTIFKYILY